MSVWPLLWYVPQTPSKPRAQAQIQDLCMGPSGNLWHRVQCRPQRATDHLLDFTSYIAVVTFNLFSSPTGLIGPTLKLFHTQGRVDSYCDLGFSLPSQAHLDLFCMSSSPALAHWESEIQLCTSVLVKTFLTLGLQHGALNRRPIPCPAVPSSCPRRQGVSFESLLFVNLHFLVFLDLFCSLVWSCWFLVYSPLSAHGVCLAPHLVMWQSVWRAEFDAEITQCCKFLFKQNAFHKF